MFVLTIDDALSFNYTCDYGKIVKFAYRTFCALQEAEGEHTVKVYDTFVKKALLNWNTKQTLVEVK